MKLARVSRFSSGSKALCLLRTCLLAVFGAALASMRPAFADEIKLPPVVRIVVPFAPGGTSDSIARVLSEQLGQRLQRTFVVDNKPGASGFIGASAVARASADGSTLMCMSMSLITAAATMRNPPIDIMKDLIPIAIIGEGPMVVVASKESGIKTPSELLALARSKPDMITHGNTGTGSVPHVAIELLNEAAKIKLRQVPYKGGAIAMNDLIAGHIDLFMGNNGPLAAQIASGRITRVAVTSLLPSPAFPDVPTIASVVPGYEASQWTAIFAPAGMAPELIQRLNREINAVTKMPKFAELFREDGAMAVSASPAEAAEKVRQSYAMWKKLSVSRKLEVD
jgi:tripartite-type tricarboxylate transporter receptor subunit TctC